MDIKNVYNQLTDVNISEQKQFWDERGKGYYGEFLLLSNLYEMTPGCCKILMNLNIPTHNSKTTEIDLLMIHENGIYVFEVKHYKGTIYGRDTDNIWTQYFRTTKNSTFKNPMLQNDYHIRAVKNLFPDVPVHSIIVFTNEDCKLNITNNNNNISVCELYNLYKIMHYRINLEVPKYSMEQINDMFIKLSEYSPMKEPIVIDGIEKSFSSWLEPAIEIFNTRRLELENEINVSNRQRKQNFIVTIIAVVACFIFFIISTYSIDNKYNEELVKIKNDYNSELSKFKQNFLHVDEIGNEYVDKLNKYVNVTNISLIELSDEAVSFTARLSMNNEVYAISLQKESKYIVMTNDNKVYEYDVFGKHLTYNAYYNSIGKGYRDYGDLVKAQFFGVNKNEITYIKITNIKLFKLDNLRTTIKEDLELELYRK